MLRGRRGVVGVVQVLVILVGIGMVLAAAFSFDMNPFSALFYAGLGAILLGVGGVARVSIPGGAIIGSAGFVMMILAVFGPSIPL